MNNPAIRIAVLHFSHETVTLPEQRHDARRLHLSGLAGERRGAAGVGPEILYGRLREGGAGVRRRRTGRHRIAAMAEDRHRLGLGDAGGLRDLRRQHDRRAQGRGGRSTASISACTAPWRCAACRVPKPNWRGGSARSSGRRLSSPRPSICMATRTKRSSTRRHGVRGEIFPALRRVSAGRTRGADAGAGDPGRLQANACDDEGAVISPTVLQWTGASPWMDLVQRALTWEAREPDVYVNVFFGFPFADVPDVGMTVQVLTNGNPELAEQVGRDIAAADLAAARGAAEFDQGAHHCRRRRAGKASGGATAIRRSCWPITATARVMRPGCCGKSSRKTLSNTLIATIADARHRQLKAMGARRAMPSTWRSAAWSMNPRASRCASGHDPQGGRRPRPVLGLRRVRQATMCWCSAPIWCRSWSRSR